MKSFNGNSNNEDRRIGTFRHQDEEDCWLLMKQQRPSSIIRGGNDFDCRINKVSPIFCKLKLYTSAHCGSALRVWMLKGVSSRARVVNIKVYVTSGFLFEQNC